MHGHVFCEALKQSDAYGIIAQQHQFDVCFVGGDIPSILALPEERERASLNTV